jgi:hypothetical protein
MKRLIQTAALLALAAAISGCELSAASKSDSKAGDKKVDKQKSEQFSMVTVADELAAKGRLMAIGTAEAVYRAENGTFATLEELVSTGLLGDPTSGKLARYRFEVRVKPDGFEATAVPEKYGVTGKQSFYLDETRIMRGADKEGEKATESDPPL